MTAIGERLRQWLRRQPPGRAELVERKHRLEGEINTLVAEARRRRGRGEDPGDVERRLAQARQRHYQTRLEIDRTEGGT